MTITCNKLPETKPELTNEEKMRKLEAMYHLGNIFKATDPIGAKLVEELMLSFNKPKHVREAIANKIRKHFGIKTKQEIEAEKARAHKRAVWRANDSALTNTLVECFRKIGYRPVRRSGCLVYSSEYRGVKDLQFSSKDDAKNWLVTAEAWDEKLYQKNLNYYMGAVDYFGNFAN